METEPPQLTPLTSVERDQLIMDTLWVVKDTAIAIFTTDILKHAHWEDLHSEGVIGLCHAANKAKKETLQTFPRFASFHIRKKLVTFWHRNNLVVPLPRAKGELAGKINTYGRDQHGELLPLPKLIELFPQVNPEHLAIVREVMVGSKTATTIVEEPANKYDNPHNQAGSIVLEETSAENVFLQQSHTDEMVQALHTLTQDERNTVLALYGFHTGTPMTPTAAAKLLQLPQKQIHQLHQEAIQKLGIVYKGEQHAA